MIHENFDKKQKISYLEQVIIQLLYPINSGGTFTLHWKQSELKQTNIPYTWMLMLRNPNQSKHFEDRQKLTMKNRMTFDEMNKINKMSVPFSPTRTLDRMTFHMNCNFSSTNLFDELIRE